MTVQDKGIINGKESKGNKRKQLTNKEVQRWKINEEN